MYGDAERRAAAQLGREGERRVAEYLKRQGYIIVKRNYRDRFGELDIVAENETELVFVEVKTRSRNTPVPGLYAITQAKQRRLRATGMRFLKRLHRSLLPRFDVAVVTFYQRPDGSREWRLNYIKNAF